jgi:hypothetical protein
MDRGRSAIAILTLLVCSCGKNPANTTGPTPLPGGTSAVGVELRILAGPTNTIPVDNAVVVVGVGSFATGPDGKLIAGPAGLAVGDPVEIQATGFLPRRTRIPSGGQIRLWPVANDAERDALRAMVYQWSGAGDAFNPPDRRTPFALSLLGATAEQRSVWTAEAASFGAMVGVTYSVATFFQYEKDELAVKFTGGDCTPDPVFAFCKDEINYMIFRVSPDKAEDAVTIDRLLASWFLGPNPFPGLLSRKAPTSSLSPFEYQTIRMMTIRDKRNRWPDDDQ